MKSTGPELKFTPREMQSASHPEKAVSVRPDLEIIKGGKRQGISQNEQFAYEKVSEIENKIQTLDKLLKEKSPENKSALDATRLEILNKQLPHAQRLRENLSAMLQLEEKGNDTLKSMQSIIAPQEKYAFTFPEIQDAWANSKEKRTYAPEVLAKLTDELDDLAQNYAQIEAQIEERKNIHIETQLRLYELENSIKEVDAIKQEIVNDVTSRIKIKKQGGSLLAESDSAIFEKIGTYLEEYETAINDERQRIASELAKVEIEIPLLEQQTSVKSVGEFLKNLINRSPKQKNAKDQLAETRGKENELKTQLERMSLIQRALGFASGHVGATPAGLSNLESRLDLTAGAGMIAPKPAEKQAPTSARVALSHESAVPVSFEFEAERIVREIMQKVKDQQARQKTEKNPSPAIVTEIPAEEIYEEDKIPELPTTRDIASSPLTDASHPDLVDTRADRITKTETKIVQELKEQTIDEKAIHIMDYIIAGVNRFSDTLEERSSRFEEKVSYYIGKIVLPEEALAVKDALQTHFSESVENEVQKSATADLLHNRFEFAKQKLLEQERGTFEHNIEFKVEDLLNPGGEGGLSTSTDAKISPKDTMPATPLRVEHKPAQKSVSERKILTPEEESQFSPLGALMSELNNKRLKPIFTAFNARKLSYENALKQAIAETDMAINPLSKEEKKHLSTMYSEMIEDLKESRTSKGKKMPAATERLLKEIAKRINPDWTEPKKPTGRWKKWLAGILSSVAIGGVAAEAGKQSERSGENQSSPSTEELKENENKIISHSEEAISPLSPIEEKPIILQSQQQVEVKPVVAPTTETSPVVSTAPEDKVLRKKEPARTANISKKKPEITKTTSREEKPLKTKQENNLDFFPGRPTDYRPDTSKKGPESLVDTSDIGRPEKQPETHKFPPKELTTPGKSDPKKSKGPDGLDIKIPQPPKKQSSDLNFPLSSKKIPPAPDKKPASTSESDQYPEEKTSKKPKSNKSEHPVDTKYIREVNEMYKAEQKLLGYKIAFRTILNNQPRLVKQQGYTGTDFAGEEKALSALEAAAKQVRDNPSAQPTDRERANKLIAAIQNARLEGLQD